MRHNFFNKSGKFLSRITERSL